jgi:hydroxymethylbilane synthase
VGTRQSTLAIAQSQLVINQFSKTCPGLEFELVGMKTKGDILLDQRLDLVSGKGLFVNEIENALLEGAVDMAVHSMKDMPAQMPEELAIAAVSEREDPRDVFITSGGAALENLKRGSTVGTSSIRREVQLLKMRPDLVVKQLRGNVLTRLDKLKAGEYDAIILAAAGLKRLGLQEECTQYFSVDEMIPAVGQGILGVQIRKDSNLSDMLATINCQDAALRLEAERTFMLCLNGGCSTPVAAHAIIEGDSLKITGMLATCADDIVKATVEGEKHQAGLLGEKLADLILSGRR